MKKLILSFTFLLASVSSIYSISYVSAGAGPVNWNVATSWTPNGIPSLNDDVTISAGHTITVSTAMKCNNLVVDGTISLTSALSIYGDYTINGTESGTGYLLFTGTATPKNISGSGSIAATTGWRFSRSRIIASDINATKTEKIYIISGASVTNNGTMSVRQMVLTTGVSWIQGPNSNLTINIYDTFFSGGYSGIGTFDASAVGNTVIHNLYSYNVPVTVSGYYNLILTYGGTKSLTSNTTVLNNLTLTRTGTSLMTLKSNGFDLAIGGNLIKTAGAYFTPSAGKTVTFNGTAPQTLSNAGTTLTFTNLTIDNPSTVTLSSGTYSLSEALTLTQGIFNAAGRFTMLSTATSTASIAPIVGTGTAVGNFTIQRYISGRDTTYCDLASPVQNSTFVDWDNELPAISYVPPASGSTQGSASTYDETGDVYVAVTSNSQPLIPGQGFEVYLSGSFTYAPFPTTTLTTIGVPTQGDQDLSSLVSANVQGWNLVGNPFASSISWASVYAASGGASSGLYDYIEMFDYTINDWADVTADDEIASTQGFWVYSDFTTTPSLFILESCKTNSTVFDIRAGKKAAPYFTLKIANATNTCAHNFKVAATSDGFDGYDRKDIPFRNSPNKATPEMYSMVEGKKINTHNFNSSNETYSISLKTKVNVSGKYTITPSGFDFIPEYTCVKLLDKLTGQIVDLKDGNGYCFTLNANDYPDRFVLEFSKDANCRTAIVAAPNVEFNNQVEVLPSAQGNVINFNLSETTNTTISVINVIGQTIVEGINIDASSQSLNIALPEGFSGLYFVKVESSKGVITKKFVKK